MSKYTFFDSDQFKFSTPDFSDMRFIRCKKCGFVYFKMNKREHCLHCEE